MKSLILALTIMAGASNALASQIKCETRDSKGKLVTESNPIMQNGGAVFSDRLAHKGMKCYGTAFIRDGGKFQMTVALKRESDKVLLVHSQAVVFENHGENIDSFLYINGFVGEGLYKQCRCYVTE